MDEKKYLSVKMNDQDLIEIFAELRPAVKRALISLSLEMDRALVKHPVWPIDHIHQAAIVVEEAGELLQAALQHKFEDKPFQAMQIEAIHTGAMAIRFLITAKNQDSNE